MRIDNLNKKLENVLFEVYDKGVKRHDCDLTNSVKKINKLLSKPKDDKIWNVFEKAYYKFKSKQIDDNYEVHKKEVIDIIKTLFPF